MLTRRAFLKTTGLALLSIGWDSTPLFLKRAVAAVSSSMPRRVLVTIFQRGGMDGVMAVTPYTDSYVQQLRPHLALALPDKSSDALLDLDGRFGLHPAFQPLLPFFKERQLAIVHGVGSPNPTRSHFDQQDYMESGTPERKGTPDGWLNRLARELSKETTPFRAVALTRILPRALYGAAPALAIPSLAEFGLNLPSAKEVAAAAEVGFEALYEQTSQPLLRSTGKESFEAMQILQKLDIRSY
ncbi:MAG: hypothetical protein RML35_10090 [Chloroherpetonaceae bacterium]|nr:hypothetical protein [Chloroherpetonaceae bacterium]